MIDKTGVSKNIKIGLLTPYTGGNLGDAAIQEAVIYNIRKRFPDASIWMITLVPAETSRIHGLSSFPITPFTILNYTPSFSKNSMSSDDNSEKKDVTYFVKKIVVKVPCLTSFAKLVHRVICRILKGFMIVWNELRHLVKAYKLVRNVDMLIASGGGQLDDYWGSAWGHPYALFKWGALSRVARKKFVFLSVGTCTLESNLSRFFIRKALGYACYRSYRDQISKKLLKHISFTTNDKIYPDLAFSYNYNNNYRNKKNFNGRKVVGVSPIAYLSKHGWPKKNELLYNRYFSVLLDFCSYLLKNHYSVILFSTDIPDRKVVSDIMDQLTEMPELESKGNLFQASTENLKELFHTLSDVDYVVASRLHGILLSQLLNIPVLAISYDRKVDTHMEEIGQQKYHVDINTVEKNEMIDIFERLIADGSSIKEDLMNTKDNYYRSLQEQYGRVLGK